VGEPDCSDCSGRRPNRERVFMHFGCCSQNATVGNFFLTFLGRFELIGSFSVIGCLHDPANVQQTSSKIPANTAGSLLDVCWIV